MTSTMEIPTTYRKAVQGYEATSGIRSMGAPREGSVFYESPTAYVRRANAENNAGGTRTFKNGLLGSVDSTIDKEIAMVGRALNVLTGGKSAQERINELKDQEPASRIAMLVWRYMGVCAYR